MDGCVGRSSQVWWRNSRVRFYLLGQQLLSEVEQAYQHLVGYAILNPEAEKPQTLNLLHLSFTWMAHN